MIQNIEDRVGKRPVTERELQEQRKNSPYLLMSYVLARYAQAQDWFNGVELGGSQTLELHHIFPKALLREKYDLRADSRTVDQVANLALLLQRANGRISSSAPDTYLTQIPHERLRAQQIPQDESLWKVENFEAFLLERRRMLAEAINRLLANLAGEPSFWTVNNAEMQEMRIDALEHTMRDLVIDRLTESFGANTWTHAIPSQIRKNVEYRIEQLLTAHPFRDEEFISLEGKLSLCQFSDYPKLIESNWTLFQDLFGKLEQFNSNYQLVTNARNAIKHNRELSRSELAAAEAGLVWLEECLRKYEQNDDESLEESVELA